MTRLSCFGLPSILSFRSPACQGCADKLACAQTAQGVLESLQHKIDVKSEMECIRHFISTHASEPATEPTVAPEITTTIAAPTRSVAPEKVKVELTDEQKAKLAELPVKVAQKMRALLQTGIGERALPEFRRGVNPFSRDTHPYLAVAAERLLAGGFTRGELRRLYMETFGWTEKTAFSRVSATVGVLLALDIAVEAGERLVLGPKARPENMTERE